MDAGQETTSLYFGAIKHQHMFVVSWKIYYALFLQQKMQRVCVIIIA